MLADQLLLLEDHRTLHELLLHRCVSLMLVLLLVHGLTLRGKLAEGLHVLVDDLGPLLDRRLLRVDVGPGLLTVVSQSLPRGRPSRRRRAIFVRLIGRRALNYESRYLVGHVVDLLLKLITSIQQVIAIDEKFTQLLDHALTCLPAL